MIEGLQLSIPQRMSLVRLTLVFSLIISVCLTFNLWGGQRHFPLTPVLNSEGLQAPYDLTFPIVAMLAWLASTVLRKQRIFLLLAFLVSVWMVCCDVTRLQPWFYACNSLLLIFVFYNGRVDDPNKYTAFFIMLQIIVASVYFFTGLSQLNEAFLEKEFIPTITPLRDMVSERQFMLFGRLGHAVPYLLIFIGVGLVISPVRYLAITMAVLVHLFLIFFLFPSEQHNNYALWFSNITFLFLVMLLFSGKTKQRYFSPMFLFQMPLFYLVMVIFVIMPFFNRKGQWPDFLSWNYASGNIKRSEISISESGFNRLPLYEKHFYQFQEGVYKLDYQRWCREELGAEFFPDQRVNRSLTTYLSKYDHGVKETELRGRP